MTILSGDGIECLTELQNECYKIADFLKKMILE